MKKLFGFFLLLVVLVQALLSGLSYLRVVSGPHSYEAASRWIFENIPRESRILGVHWDDKLPLHLPGFSPHDYGFKYEGEGSDLVIYEPDTMPKLDGMCRQLEISDYLIFPTQRIPGSIMRVPEEFPYSSALLQLLYAGKLGYELVATIKTQPGIGPFEFNTDLADESISVYDHPKVTIFKNVERLGEHEIKERVLDSSSWGPLPTRTEILLLEGAYQGKGETSSALGSVVAWLLVLTAASFLGRILLGAFLQEDEGVLAAFAPIVGVLFWGLFNFFLELSGLVTDPWGGLLVLLLLLSLACMKEKNFSSSWREINFSSSTSLIFISSFTAFLILRMFQPEIFWGEKTMDFSFFNYFSRGTELPPQDPWAAGNRMQYYYLGFYLFAELGRVLSIPTFYGYNLALATVGALLFTGFYGVFLYFSRSRLYALSGAAALCLLSNLEWIHLLFFKKEEIDFDFFWATTRLFTSPSFSEYPLWSQLFADFHPHVISQPFVLAALWLMGVGLTQSLRHGIKKNRVLLGAAALTWGALLALNTWDFIASAVFIALFSLMLLVNHWVRDKKIFEGGRSILLALLLLASIALGSALPYLVQSGGSRSLEWGWVTEAEFNTALQLFKHLGLWLVPIILGGGVVAYSVKRTSKTVFIVMAVCGLIPWMLAAASSLKGIENIPWGIIAISSALMLVGGFLASAAEFSREESSDDLLWAGVLSASGGLLIVMCELFFLLDRMNTIFKFYQAVWMFLGASAVLISIRVMRIAAFSSWTRAWAPRAALSVSFAVVCAALIGSVFNVFSMLTFQRVEGPRPALDGLAYLERSKPDEYRLARWIGDHIKGTPVILEAHGPSYQDYTRISMYTGLPTVLGWEHHVMQRGTPLAAIRARKEAVKTIYETRDIEEAEKLSDIFSVDLIVLGDAERRQYKGEGLKKFENNIRYRKLVSFGGVSLFQRRRFFPSILSRGSS